MISPVSIWRKQKQIRNVLGKKGTVLSWTKISVAGTDFKSYAPYLVALAELETGEKIFGQIVDMPEEKLTIGRKIIVTLRKVRAPSSEGVIAYGIKFKLL